MHFQLGLELAAIIPLCAPSLLNSLLVPHSFCNSLSLSVTFTGALACMLLIAYLVCLYQSVWPSRYIVTTVRAHDSMRILARFYNNQVFVARLLFQIKFIVYSLHLVEHIVCFSHTDITLASSISLSFDGVVAATQSNAPKLYYHFRSSAHLFEYLMR